MGVVAWVAEKYVDTVTVPLWGVAAVLTLGLLLIHMTDPLGLEF